MPYQHGEMAWPVLVDPIYPTESQKHAILFAESAARTDGIHPNWTNPVLWEVVARDLALLDRRREKNHE